MARPKGSSKNDNKRIVRFSWETLELPCEWECCTVVKDDMSEYMKHIESCHLSKVSESDLHCHWKDCEAFTETLPDLYRHILFHAFHTKIKCYGKNLQRRKELPSCTLDAVSRNVIPELPDPLICTWDDCEEVFENPELFYRHLDFHIDSSARKERDQDSSICLWQGCNREFGNHYKVRDHIRSHTQEKLIACPTCGGMFASRTKFFDHIQRQTPINEDKEEGFSCDYCNRKMKTERLLRDHMRHHVNHYKCPYCDMTCPTPSGLQTHVLYRHSDAKPYSCQYCDYKCKAQRDLRKHLETHSTVLAFTCSYEGCNYASRSHTCYINHIRRKHENKNLPVYVCHLCPKKFARGNYLTYHLTTRHKFRWPSGHCRFRYHQDKDGLFRLQTVRYESFELSEAMLCEDELSSAILCKDGEDVDSPDSVEQVSSTDQASGQKDRDTPVPETQGAVKSSVSVQNSELSVSSMTLYVPAERCSALAVNDSEQNSGSYQQVILQVMETNKTLTTSDGSSIVLLKIPDSGATGSEFISALQLVGQNG